MSLSRGHSHLFLSFVHLCDLLRPRSTHLWVKVASIIKDHSINSVHAGSNLILNCLSQPPSNSLSLVTLFNLLNYFSLSYIRNSFYIALLKCPLHVQSTLASPVRRLVLILIDLRVFILEIYRVFSMIYRKLFLSFDFWTVPVFSFNLDTRLP
jgi:hypothetical protein